MNFFILRHGIAVEPGTQGYKDSERPLTDEGKCKLRKICKAMKQLDLSFDLILSSPYKRARQTAEIVAEHFNEEVEFTDSLTPQGSMQELIAEINQIKPLPENVMVVGHEPYLSELLSLLVSGETRFGVTLKKAGLAKISVDDLKYGRCGSLEWLLTPKVMKLAGA